MIMAVAQDLARQGAAEKDPTGREAHSPGSKLDDGKAPVWRGLLDYFPRAVKAVSLVSLFGSRKYEWKGWESVPDGIDRYADALARHMIDLSTGYLSYADISLVCLLQRAWPMADKEIVHRAQIAWNALASLELAIRKTELKTSRGLESRGLDATPPCPQPLFQGPAGKPIGAVGMAKSAPHIHPWPDTRDNEIPF